MVGGVGVCVRVCVCVFDGERRGGGVPPPAAASCPRRPRSRAVPTPPLLPMCSASWVSPNQPLWGMHCSHALPLTHLYCSPHLYCPAPPRPAPPRPAPYRRCVSMNQVRGIFGFTSDDNIGKIAFPAVQVRRAGSTAAARLWQCAAGWLQQVLHASCSKRRAEPAAYAGPLLCCPVSECRQPPPSPTASPTCSETARACGEQQQRPPPCRQTRKLPPLPPPAAPSQLPRPLCPTRSHHMRRPAWVTSHPLFPVPHHYRCLIPSCRHPYLPFSCCLPAGA